MVPWAYEANVDAEITETKMSLNSLATELVLQVFRSCTSIADVLNLSLTCRRFHQALAGSQRLAILAHAAEVEYGPMKDIVQLVTQNASQPAHLIREAPMSLNLLQQVVEVGRVAKKWEEIYPLKKWKINFEDRRLLTDVERWCLRRAIYRLWLYCRAFHSPLYPRTSRLAPPIVRERAELLHNWTTTELAEIEDTRLVVRDVVQNHICPSNSTIQRKFHKRYPDHQHPLLFNVHLHPPPLAYSHFAAAGRESCSPPDPETEPFSTFPNKIHRDDRPVTHIVAPSNKYATKFRLDLYHEPGLEGWGDDIPHYYVVEDMLKLDPGQVIWLRENAHLKQQVEQYVRGLGDWFDNNGETFGQTVDWVLSERGEDIVAFRDGLVDGELGVARNMRTYSACSLS